MFEHAVIRDAKRFPRRGILFSATRTGSFELPRKRLTQSPTRPHSRFDHGPWADGLQDVGELPLSAPRRRNGTRRTIGRISVSARNSLEWIRGNRTQRIGSAGSARAFRGGRAVGRTASGRSPSKLSFDLRCRREGDCDPGARHEMVVGSTAPRSATAPPSGGPALDWRHQRSARCHLRCYCGIRLG